MIKIIPIASRVTEDKGKGRLLKGHRMHGRGIEEQLYPLTSALDGCLTTRVGRFTPEKVADTRCTRRLKVI